MDLVAANAYSDNVSILLNRNIEADIALSSSFLKFGQVKKDSTETMQLIIYNCGFDSTLHITNISASNPFFAPNTMLCSVGSSSIVEEASRQKTVQRHLGDTTLRGSIFHSSSIKACWKTYF